MVKQEDDQLSEGAIAVSAFHVYRNSFKGTAAATKEQEKLEWDDLDDDQQSAWLSVAERATEILDDCENLPWVTFAAQIFEMWARRMSYPVQEFSELTTPVQAAWVAVARHVANLCALESNSDITEHEDRWIGAAARLGQAVGA